LHRQTPTNVWHLVERVELVFAGTWNVREVTYYNLVIGLHLLEDCIIFLPNDSHCTAGGIPVLVGLLGLDRQVVQCMATAVLCHMSENAKVCEGLVHHGAVPELIKLLSGHQPELHSRCAVILADLAGHSEQHQNLITQLVSQDTFYSICSHLKFLSLYTGGEKFGTIKIF